MALITRCDRCMLTEVSVTKVLGYDICVACVADFKDWILAGQAAAVPVAAPRAGQGKRWLQVEALLVAHGHVTAELLSKATGMQRSSANWYLHSVYRHGKLDYHGSGVFTKPKSEAAE